MIAISHILAKAGNVAPAASDYEWLRLLILGYLACAGVAGLFLMVAAIYQKTFGVLAFLEDQVILAFVLVALFWPIWVTLLLVAWSRRQPVSPTAPSAKAVSRPVLQHKPVAARTSGIARCTECARPFASGATVCMWRGCPVCGDCRKTLAVLGA